MIYDERIYWYSTAGLNCRSLIVVPFSPSLVDFRLNESIMPVKNRIQAELIASETTLWKNSRAADQFTERLYLGGLLNNLFSYDNTSPPPPRQMGQI